MTIIAVVNDQIYTDSFCVTDGLVGSTNKVRDSLFGKYAVAGCPNTAIRFIQHLEREGDLYLPVQNEDPDHTCIVLRTAGSIKCVYMGRTGETMSDVLRPDNLGLQYVAGSARAFFLAYFAEHGSVQHALELTAKYHSDVAGPFSVF